MQNADDSRRALANVRSRGTSQRSEGVRFWASVWQCHRCREVARKLDLWNSAVVDPSFDCDCVSERAGDEAIKYCRETERCSEGTLVTEKATAAR